MWASRTDDVANLGFFVSGTDTGVGKTVVSCALLRGLRERGLAVGAMKPVETGVGEAGPLDAQALREAAGSDDAIEDICPQRFRLPAAPNIAARHEGRRVDLELIRETFERRRGHHDLMVVEGAGGLLVPTDDAGCMAELARDFGLPIVLVARASLGTINHTLLSLNEIERRGLALAGVVISHSNGALSPADAAGCDHLRERLGTRLVGEVPPLAAGEAAPSSCIDVARLLKGPGC